MFIWVLFFSFLWGDEITADLRNPIYKQGVLYTNQGGVVRGKDLRIQAQSIQYIRRKDSHRLEAEGDLMLMYKDHVFVGSSLEYDFLTHSGLIYNGKTSFSPWYLGGDEILIHEDGSYKITDAFFTTCENKESSWDLHAREVSVSDGVLQTNKLRIRLGTVPIFVLPSFKVAMHHFKDPIFRYSINWDKSQGPRVSARYRFYSTQTAALYGRLEYRWGTGFGGAFESEYCSPDEKVQFMTRSYLGTDTMENAPDKERRYRLQGILDAEHQKTHTLLTWDKYSDVRMPNDFKSDDFEVNSAQRTLLSVVHREPNALLSFKIRPRVNPFESIKQDLPSFFFSIRPLPLGKSGIVLDLLGRAAYLKFSYSDRLIESIMGLNSFRVELRPLLYRSCIFGPLILTPHLGGVGIFYSDRPVLATLAYGGSLCAHGLRCYDLLRHTLQPYCNYYGLLRPTLTPDQHPIFSIQDGYQKINQLQIGLRNTLSDRSTFIVDLYANIFLGPHHFTKIYLLLHWQYPSLELLFTNAWNVRHRTIDYSNALLRWTMNEHAALSLEVRYRSPYDWRKSDHENFILDVSHPESELLASPVSDQRITLLFHAFFRLSPFWECQLQSHHGYVNKTPGNPYSKQPYNECKIDLFTWLSSAWKLRFSYTHTQLDDRITAGLSLVK
jgi:hypothetical protein